MKYFFSIIVVFTLLYNGILLYVNQNIESINHKNVYNNCHKVWSSRGFYASHSEQNSLNSFENAFSLGYNGVEVDFYYDLKMDKFIVSHDRVKKDKKGNFYYSLKNGKLFTLENLLDELGDDHYFWLDYKNLDRLSKEETQNAIKRLNYITKGSNLKERLYIEGSTPNTLDIYTKAGYKTLFAFQPLKADSIFSSISSNIYKIA
jgi:glycerophosphoryl diester phosphodiesterase